MRLRLSVSALALAGLALAGCSSGSGGVTASGASGSGASVAGSADPALHAQLPAAIRSSDVIRVASTFGYPPQQFYADDNTTPKGISVDLGNALGNVLGVKFQFTNTTFDSIIPGLTSGRYDVSIASMSATPVRAEQVLFVDYLNAGATIVTKKGNPLGIHTLADLCGHDVGQIAGSTYVDALNSASVKVCAPAGKPKINVQIYQDVTASYQAVITGRSDAVYKDFAANAYAVQQSAGQLVVVSSLTPDVPYGIAIAKGNAPLAKAMQAALQQLIRDGGYAKILKAWGVEAGAVTEARLVGLAG